MPITPNAYFLTAEQMAELRPRMNAYAKSRGERVGQNIKGQRLYGRMTQAHIAACIGTAPTTLAALEYHKKDGGTAIRIIFQIVFLLAQGDEAMADRIFSVLGRPANNVTHTQGDE